MIAQKAEITAFHAHKATIAIADKIYVCNTLQARKKKKKKNANRLKIKSTTNNCVGVKCSTRISMVFIIANSNKIHCTNTSNSAQCTRI